MNVDDWQANRIQNSRYLQQELVKPWPCGIQVQILGAAGSGRHSLLSRVCNDDSINFYHPFGTDSDSACKQATIRGLSCSIWLETPLPLTAFGSGFPFTRQEHFEYTILSIRDCDALILVFDLTKPKSFQILREFCVRCEAEGVGISPGTSLPCLVVGTHSDEGEEEDGEEEEGEGEATEAVAALENGKKLAEKLGGAFMACSASKGIGFERVVEEAVVTVIDARTKLMQESEESLGEAIRSLISQTCTRKRERLRKRLLRYGSGRKSDVPRRPGSSSSSSRTAAARCSGAPPRWTMRKLVSPRGFVASSEGTTAAAAVAAGRDRSSLMLPCPPEYQLSVDLVELASGD